MWEKVLQSDAVRLAILSTAACESAAASATARREWPADTASLMASSRATRAEAARWASRFTLASGSSATLGNRGGNLALKVAAGAESERMGRGDLILTGGKTPLKFGNIGLAGFDVGGPFLCCLRFGHVNIVDTTEARCQQGRRP